MSKGLVQFGIKNNDKDVFAKEFCSTIDSIKIDSYGRAICVPKYHMIPEIKTVIFNPPYTIVKWCDDTVTKIRCINEDDFNEEIGLAMAISRKYYDFVINTGWALAKKDKKETKGARAEFKKQVKNAKRPKKKE